MAWNYNVNSSWIYLKWWYTLLLFSMTWTLILQRKHNKFPQYFPTWVLAYLPGYALNCQLVVWYQSDSDNSSDGFTWISTWVIAGFTFWNRMSHMIKFIQIYSDHIFLYSLCTFSTIILYLKQTRYYIYLLTFLAKSLKNIKMRTRSYYFFVARTLDFFFSFFFGGK